VEQDAERPGRERGHDHDQTHRVVQDHRLKGGEPEQADQQRQRKLRAAQADHAAEDADQAADGEPGRQRL